MLLALTLLACDRADDTDAIEEILVRLSWFQAEVEGDPALAPNPHAVWQATSSDGISFTGAEEVFAADDLLDPDLFPLADGYGLLHGSGAELAYAYSSSPSGPFVAQGGPVASGGQPATAEIDGALRTFVTGISAFPLEATRAGATAGEAHPVVSAADLGLPDHLIADPSVVQLTDGTWRLLVKALPFGGGLDAHDVWMLSSPDATSWSEAALVREQASVPGAVAVADALFVYFVDVSQELNPNLSLAVAISDDGGATFRFEPVLLDGDPIAYAFDPTALPGP